MSGPHTQVSTGRALLPGLALVSACNGRGRELAEAVAGFGEAMRVVAIIGFVFAALAGLVYLSIWAWLITGWRRGRAPRAAAIILVLVHAGSLLVAGAEPNEVAHAWLRWTAVLPAAALALAFAARLPARLALGAAATAALCLLPTAPGPLRALPAPIADLSSAFVHACVVLAGGEVVCQGDEMCEADEASREYFSPHRVAALSDVDGVYAQTGLTCARRRTGPPVCCGNAYTLPAPSSSRGPWQLPIGGPDSTFAVSQGQILARTGDTLHAWPHPLPAGLHTARALTVTNGLEVHFAVVDRAGELWMWRQDGAAIADLARFSGLDDAEEVAVQRRTGACVRRTSGTVACFPWPGQGEPRSELPDLRAVQLVALDDAFDSFCVRTPEDAVRCWSDDAPPRPFAALPTATRLLSTHSALCDLGARVRCVPVMHDVDTPLADLLALPVAP